MAAPPDQVSYTAPCRASTDIQADALSAGLSKMSMEDYTSTSSPQTITDEQHSTHDQVSISQPSLIITDPRFRIPRKPLQSSCEHVSGQVRT